jgi:hypothetical protein
VRGGDVEGKNKGNRKDKKMAMVKYKGPTFQMKVGLLV